MSLETFRQERLQVLINRVAAKDDRTLGDLEDLLLWGFYGTDVFSQFGMGLSGYVIRQRRESTVLTVKATESGVPLVAFVTSGSTMGCIEQMYDLLFAGKLKWQKDKYPWI